MGRCFEGAPEESVHGATVHAKDARDPSAELKWVDGRSHREIANALGVAVGTPSKLLTRTQRAKITNWGEVEALSDEELDDPQPV
jgi:transposase